MPRVLSGPAYEPAVFDQVHMAARAVLSPWQQAELTTNIQQSRTGLGSNLWSLQRSIAPQPSPSIRISITQQSALIDAAMHHPHHSSFSQHLSGIPGGIPIASDGLQGPPAAACVHAPLALKPNSCKYNQHECKAQAAIQRLYTHAPCMACSQKMGLRVLRSFPAL